MLRPILSVGVLTVGLAVVPTVGQPTSTRPQSFVASAGSAPLEEPAGGQRTSIAELDAELIFRILFAEFAAQRGNWFAAYQTSHAIAFQTRDPRFAQGAVEFALNGNDTQLASEAANLWVELMPMDEAAQQTALMLAVSQGLTPELISHLRQQIGRTQDKSEAIAQTQQILTLLPDDTQMLTALDQVFDGQLRHLPDARLALADAALAAGHKARALQEARAALALRPGWDEAAEMVLEAGMAIEPDKALATTREFLAAYPEAQELRFSLVSALVQRGDFEGALATLPPVKGTSVEDLETMYFRGAISLEAGDVDAAEDWLESYVRLEQERQAGPAERYEPFSYLPDAQLLRAAIAEEQGRFDQAFEILGTLRPYEGQFQTQLRQAVVRGKQGRVSQALDILAALDLQDEHDASLLALTRAQILRSAGRVDAAIETLKAAVHAAPNVTEIRFELAQLYKTQGQVFEVEQQLRTVIALDPFYADAYKALAYTLADHDTRLGEAERLAKRALELEPYDPSIMACTGWVLYRLNDRNGAIDLLEQAWHIRQGPEVGVRLGEVLWKNEQTEEAKNVWRRVSVLDRGNPLLKETLQRLGVLL